MAAAVVPAGEGMPGASAGHHAWEGLSGDWARYVPPLPPGQTTYGVAVLLHADDDTPAQPTEDARLRAAAAAQGVILLAVDSPGPVDSGCWWSPHKHLRLGYLDDLLQAQIFSAYPVDRGRVHLVGKSGGAFWASGAPFYADLSWRGGIVAVCGGDVPRVESAVDWCAISETEDDPALLLDPVQAARAEGWRAVFVSTLRDPWRQNALDAAALYRSLGGDVVEVTAGRRGHCALDDVGWMIAGLRWVDAP